jgi:hypothetical protein
MMTFDIPEGTEDPEAFAEQISRSLRGIGAAVDPRDRTKLNVFGNSLDQQRPDSPVKYTIRQVLEQHGVRIKEVITGVTPAAEDYAQLCRETRSERGHEVPAHFAKAARGEL